MEFEFYVRWNGDFRDRSVEHSQWLQSLVEIFTWSSLPNFLKSLSELSFPLLMKLQSCLLPCDS